MNGRLPPPAEISKSPIGPPPALSRMSCIDESESRREAGRMSRSRNAKLRYCRTGDLQCHTSSPRVFAEHDPAAIAWRGEGRWIQSPHRKADQAGKVIKPDEQRHAVAAAAGRNVPNGLDPARPRVSRARS